MTHFTQGGLYRGGGDPCRRGEIGSACRTPQSVQDGLFSPEQLQTAGFAHWARQVGMKTVLR